jgi:hypothetical protein
MLNSDGELRAIMGLTGDGEAVLQFLDDKGEPAWTSPATFAAPPGAGHGSNEPAGSEGSPQG